MKVLFLLILSLQLNLTFAQKETETSVLFIGNSFTFYNDMPFIFKDIAESFGRNVHVDTVVTGGKNLKYHSSRKETYEKINSRNWTYVVIQGHSDEFAQPESVINTNTLPYAKQITDSVLGKNKCTKIILYLTWGYKNGNSKWAPISTYPTMQDVIVKQYLRVADLLSASVSPVGVVWKDVRAKNPSINLYNPDNHHPSLQGSFVSACTFYTSIFGVSPMNTSIDIKLTKEEKSAIELIATQTVLNDRPKWRWTDRFPSMESGFDILLQNKDLVLVNRAENFNTIEWNFGDGEVSNETDAKHEFNRKGEYNVIQKISNDCEILELKRTILVR